MGSIPVAHSSRDLFPGHGAGKGDAERSSGWRNNYSEINWPGVSGLQRDRRGRLVKTYGPKPPEFQVVAHSNPEEGVVCVCAMCSREIPFLESWEHPIVQGYLCITCYNLVCTGY